MEGPQWTGPDRPDRPAVARPAVARPARPGLSMLKIEGSSGAERSSSSPTISETLLFSLLASLASKCLHEVNVPVTSLRFPP